MEPAIPTVDVDSPPPYNDLPPQQQQGYLNDAFVPDGGDEEKSRKNLQFGDDPKHVTIWSKETVSRKKVNRIQHDTYVHENAMHFLGC